LFVVSYYVDSFEVYGTTCADYAAGAIGIAVSIGTTTQSPLSSQSVNVECQVDLSPCPNPGDAFHQLVTRTFAEKVSNPKLLFLPRHFHCYQREIDSFIPVARP
jgi:hypothetical protein